ncbi:Ig-like domain-containing protein [Mycobacterium sp. PS03-16]|uniref:Ig-like domain-containing protein n=1 Tax=Mycobacterium sp. PS03-16 TaxID=2559611 RepID=UPI001FD7FD2E|nr:Ig-like domain-containing protein [Mycobacterium sp. PS03-16]
MRRWLQLGAASAGVGVGLMGFALLGPTAVAGAETAGESTQSSSAAGDDARSADSAGTGGSGAAESGSADVGEPGTDAEDSDDTDAAGGVDAEDEADDLADDTDEDSSEVAHEDTSTVDDEDDAEVEAAPAADRADTDAVTAASTANNAVVPTSSAAAPVAARRATPDNWSEFAGEAITNWTRSSQGWIRSLPVDGAARYHLEGALLATRRTLFNQAPTVAPIQASGKLDGPIAGSIGAVDPEGDRLTYVIVARPGEGTLQLNRDGTYTYTPGATFDGVDSFRVVAVDNGLHVNLLDPFRPWGTRSTSWINQRAITFDFDYTTGAEHWTPERRDALQDSADALLVYFTVKNPVILTYEVTAIDDPESSILASAGSGLISQDPGFWPTVVQHEVITGIDANGAAADGEIEWNFGAAWGLGDTVGPDEFDFQSTAMHELMHSFGFLSYLDAPGENDGDTWALYDRFIRTSDGRRPIDGGYEWDTRYDPNLIGTDGGLYFAGRKAVAGYDGALVPIFTPDPWSEGSSGSHLDDFTFTGDNQLMMNARTDTGLGIRVLSPMEIGILRDLGYQVNAPAPATLALGLIGFLFVGRLRKKMASTRD